MPGRPCERRSGLVLEVAHDAAARPGARSRVTSGSGDDAGRWNDPRPRFHHVVGIGSATSERTDERSPPLSYSPSLDNDTVDQQQPVMNSQTDLRAGHEDLRLIGVNAFNAPLRGPPFINARCHPHPGRVHLAADRRRFWSVGGHRDGRRRLRRAGQTGRDRLAAGPGFSPHGGYRTMLRLPL